MVFLIHRFRLKYSKALGNEVARMYDAARKLEIVEDILS